LGRWESVEKGGYREARKFGGLLEDKKEQKKER